jgi:hypothetical protein
MEDGMNWEMLAAIGQLAAAPVGIPSIISVTSIRYPSSGLAHSSIASSGISRGYIFPVETACSVRNYGRESSGR